MGRPALEVADIFRAHGSAWRQTQQGHLSLGQLKVMSAIEQCRSAALGRPCFSVAKLVRRCRSLTTHVAIGTAQVSSRGRPAVARGAQADLLPVEYYHVVFTL